MAIEIKEDGSVFLGSWCGMDFSLPENVVAELRAALCQPDPAAEARATLDRARDDDVIYWHRVWSPCTGRDTWQVQLCIKSGQKDFEGATEAEALAAAAAHAESLRKPVVVEPEEMSFAEIRAEMVSLKYTRCETSKRDGVYMDEIAWTRFDNSDIVRGENEGTKDFHCRALRTARARAAQQ